MAWTTDLRRRVIFMRLRPEGGIPNQSIVRALKFLDVVTIQL